MFCRLCNWLSLLVLNEWVLSSCVMEFCFFALVRFICASCATVSQYVVYCVRFILLLLLLFCPLPLLVLSALIVLNKRVLSILPFIPLLANLSCAPASCIGVFSLLKSNWRWLFSCLMVCTLQLQQSLKEEYTCLSIFKMSSSWRKKTLLSNGKSGVWSWMNSVWVVFVDYFLHLIDIFADIFRLDRPILINPI